uniref:Myc-associated zinc finger protein n=1 Tax=Gasterosteus aculeatus TaxID=69293 RepID=G3PPR3_GASAC
MDTSWSNFLFQTSSSQTQPETPLQSDLMPELSGSAPSPPGEHVGTPPSTVDTAALSEEPLPGDRDAFKHLNHMHSLNTHTHNENAVVCSGPRYSFKPLPKPGRSAHVCATCNKEFKNSYNLRRHQSVHTGIKMKDRAARENNREARQVPVSITPATITMAAPPQPIQGAVVVTSLTFPPQSPHPNATQVRKNHACEACGKAFRDVYHLNRHRLSHSDEKPYSCPVCQQRFKRKDRMSYHVRSHQGGVEKPYVCPHCAKAFSRPDHLNSHVRQVHSTERPFKCTTCTSAFATRDRLRAHLIRHEEKVPCHICGKLLSAAYITDHMRVHNQSQHHACHLCNR